MYEYIFPRLALDETKAFAGVEPFDCSLFFAHFVILFSLKSYLVPRKPELGFQKVLPHSDSSQGSGRLQLRSCVTAVRAQKKAASLTRDRFTTSKAIQEQQTQTQDTTKGS
jgi:hypothetical protein